MATREPPVELFDDPDELDPTAPRLRVTRNGVGWELRDDAGVLLGTHPTEDDAVEAALERWKLRFSEILVRSSTGRAEWRMDQDPELLRAIEFLQRRWEKRQRESGRPDADGDFRTGNRHQSRG